MGLRFLPRLGRKHLPIAIALGAIVIIGGTRYLMAASEPSCNSLREGDSVESQDFIPAQEQLSQLPDLPMKPDGGAAPPVPLDARLDGDALDGLPMQWAIVRSDGVYQYYFSRPIDSALRLSAFQAEGGLQYQREPRGEASFASFLLGSLGERAIPVAVGPYDGAIVWADPEPSGIRTHNLYWSDSEFNYALIGDRSAAQLINLARGIACG